LAHGRIVIFLKTGESSAIGATFYKNTYLSNAYDVF